MSDFSDISKLTIDELVDYIFENTIVNEKYKLSNGLTLIKSSLFRSLVSDDKSYVSIENNFIIDMKNKNILLLTDKEVVNLK